MIEASSYKTAERLGLALLVGGVLYLFVRALDLVLASLFLPEALQSYSRAMGSNMSISTILLSGMVSPFIEEFIFRRKLYGFVALRLRSWISTLLVATLFCFMHVELYGTLYMINIFLMGIVCQKLVNSSGSIVSSTACHAAFNICVLAPKQSVADTKLALGVPELDTLWFAGIVALVCLSVMAPMLRSPQLATRWFQSQSNAQSNGPGSN